MYFFSSWLSLLEVLLLLLPILIAVAFVTVAERKTMASMQRRLGPNHVGYYGLLQAFKFDLWLIELLPKIYYNFFHIFYIFKLNINTRLKESTTA